MGISLSGFNFMTVELWGSRDFVVLVPGTCHVTCELNAVPLFLSLPLPLCGHRSESLAYFPDFPWVCLHPPRETQQNRFAKTPVLKLASWGQISAT